MKTTLSEMTKDQLADLVIDILRNKVNSSEVDGQALHALLVEAWAAEQFRARWLRRKAEHNEALIDHMLKEEGFSDVEE